MGQGLGRRQGQAQPRPRPQDWPPQHKRRQLSLPLGGRGRLLGQAGPPHLAPAPLHAGPRLVGRGAREGLAQGVAAPGEWWGLGGGALTWRHSPVPVPTRCWRPSKQPSGAASPAPSCSSPMCTATPPPGWRGSATGWRGTCASTASTTRSRSLTSDCWPRPWAPPTSRPLPLSPGYLPALPVPGRLRPFSQAPPTLTSSISTRPSAVLASHPPSQPSRLHPVLGPTHSPMLPSGPSHLHQTCQPCTCLAGSAPYCQPHPPNLALPPPGFTHPT